MTIAAVVMLRSPFVILIVILVDLVSRCARLRRALHKADRDGAGPCVQRHHGRNLRDKRGVFARDALDLLGTETAHHFRGHSVV